jgi:tetratricopeptide (TPR) repeat protein
VTAERWQQIKDIVTEALEENSSERRSELLVERCAGDPELLHEVESLLDQTTGALENFAEKAATPLRQNRSGLEPGRRMGVWAIVRELGRGGMGAVYLAERADGAFEKQVAIKVLKRGTDTDEILRRFDAERQILARLDHPNITRLIDAGTTDQGLPYVVMDYVAGRPITHYASDKQLAVTERLKLFCAVCSAVSYAHQNLVVHRDLKPSNILVTDKGEVRLLDFGIAKLLSDAEAVGADMTITALRVMTPEYASPEQIKGEPITTLSDVYSLGICLYELLTGARPYKLTRKTPEELSKAICEQEPERPSTTVARHGRSKLEIRNSKFLSGDLDNIVLMALRKEPARRYASVGQFSEDLRRHLEGLPVRARKDTAAYRTTKFVMRHKLGVAAGVAIVLVLVVGMFATAWEWASARTERAKAEKRFEILRKSSRTMISEIHGALMNLSGSLEARKLLLQRATEQLDALAADSANDPRLQVDLAEAYHQIGYLPDKPLDERVELFNKAIALDQKVLAREPKHIAARENLAMSKINLADFARARGDSNGALKSNREAIALLESVVADEPAEMEHKKTLWNASYNTALSLMQLGRAAEALEISRRIYPVAVELREKHTSDSSDHRFRRPYLSRSFAANSLTYLGRYDEAITELRGALQEIAAVRQRFPLGQLERLDESVSTYRLAVAFDRSGHPEEAIQTMTTSLTAAEALSNDEPKDVSYRIVVSSQNSQFASLLLRANKTAESVKYFRRAVELYENILGADPAQKQARADLAYAYGGLGLALAETGNVTEAMDDERKAISSYEKLDPVKNSNIAVLRDYAETLDRSAEVCLFGGTNDLVAEAKPLFQQSLSVWIEMRHRDALSKVDARKPEEMSAKIARCDAALN